MDTSEALQKMLEAIISKRDKDGKKYPGTDGDTFRWKRQVEREIGDKKKHGWRLWTRLNEDLRTPKEFIIVEEAPSEDKDKEKDKDKDKDNDKDKKNRKNKNPHPSVPRAALQRRKQWLSGSYSSPCAKSDSCRERCSRALT